MTEHGMDAVEAEPVLEALGVEGSDLDIQPLAEPKPAFLTLVLLLGSLSALGPLAIDMYLPSFPQLAVALGTAEHNLPRTLAAYFVGLSLGQLVYGPASDRWGRKLPLNIGLVIFILTSLGCTFATSLDSMVALRFLQALGGCAQMVVSRAIVRDLFDTRDSARVFSALILVMGVAPIVAPIIGGWMSTHWSWKMIFLSQAVAASLCVVTVNLVLGESLPHHRRRKHAIRRILGQYAELMRHREFMVYSVIGGLISGGLFAYVGGSPFVFMTLFGVKEEHFGYVFGTNAAGFILASQVNGFLVSRVHPRRILGAALAACACMGVTLLGIALMDLGGMAGFLIPLWGFVACMGFILPTTTALALAPHGEMAGNASALLGCVQFILAACGAMVIGQLAPTSQVPLAAIIATCGFSALVLHTLLLRNVVLRD